MELHYKFDELYHIGGCEFLDVKENDFVYTVDETGDYDELHKKYYDKALMAAAMSYLCNYGDFICKASNGGYYD